LEHDATVEVLENLGGIVVGLIQIGGNVSQICPRRPAIFFGNCQGAIFGEDGAFAITHLGDSGGAGVTTDKLDVSHYVAGADPEVKTVGLHTLAVDIDSGVLSVQAEGFSAVDDLGGIKVRLGIVVYKLATVDLLYLN
jgi:hypothetical protein